MNKKKVGVIIEIIAFIAVLGIITFFYYFNGSNKESVNETSEVGIIKITDENFKEEILNSDIPVILEFSSNMCPPCLTMIPTLIHIAKNNNDIKVATMNINDDNAKTTSEEYFINATPTIMIFKNGQVVNSFIGAISEEEIMNVVKQLED